jgi:hypothetical protein
VRTNQILVCSMVLVFISCNSGVYGKAIMNLWFAGMVAWG